MILVIVACFLAWRYFSNGPTQKIMRIAIVGLIMTGITTAIAASLPITEVPIGSTQELRVMPPTAFPFTMQQYRDYDSNQFYYRIVLGWPDGIPIFKGTTQDDQSEYIHLAHLNTGILLGEYMLVGLVSILAVVSLFEARKVKTRDVKTTAAAT